MNVATLKMVTNSGGVYVGVGIRFRFGPFVRSVDFISNYKIEFKDTNSQEYTILCIRRRELPEEKRSFLY